MERISPELMPDAFAEEVRGLEAALHHHPPNPGCTLFYGSSTIRLWDRAQEHFPQLETVNHGFGGSTLAECVQYFPRLVVPVPARTLVFYAGDNDLAQGASPAAVLECMEHFEHLMQAHKAQTPVFFFTIKPSPSRMHLLPNILATNEGLRAFAAKYPRYHLLDPFPHMLGLDRHPVRRYFSGDDLHLSPEGYDLWAGLLRTAFMLAAR